MCAARQLADQRRACQARGIACLQRRTIADLFNSMTHTFCLDTQQQAVLRTLVMYHEAFAEHDATRRRDLLARSMTPDAQIWGPKRVFAGYEEISEKIEGFHKNWPGCRLALATGFNAFLNTMHLGCAIIGSDGAVRAVGRSVIELADDGRIQRVLPLWEELPPLPAGWPPHFAPNQRKQTAG